MEENSEKSDPSKESQRKTLEDFMVKQIMILEKKHADGKGKKTYIKPELLVPQPHFIPGYSGFVPELPMEVGRTYSRATHEIMKRRPEVASRIPVVAVDSPSVLDRREERMTRDRMLINSRSPADGSRILYDPMVPGYGGHVPHIADAVGVNYTKGCVKTIAKFIREQAEARDETTSL